MRLNSLKLLAFGPFSDTVIDLSHGDPGLHLIYGPNEAGKSSALRGLLQLLFGIPPQTPDDFIHSYPNLRIGAELQDDDGRVLSVVRRKAKTNTLRGEDDVTIVDEEELRALLRGEDKNTYRTRFGIDLDELQQGSHSILRGEGRIGEMLFAAGSGLSDVRRVLDALQSEAESLYKTTGKNPPLNSLLGELSRTRAELSSIQLSSSEWAEHDQALHKAKERKQALDDAYAAKRQEQVRLERIQRGHPLLARRKELARSLEAYVMAPALPVDFAERWRELISDMKVAGQEERSAGREREAVRKELAGIELPDALLDQADTVEALHQEQGSIAKAGADRDKLAGELRQAERDRKRILEDLPGLQQDQGHEVRAPDRARQGLIQELAARYERLDTQLEAAHRELAETGPAIEAVERELGDLGDLPDVGGLSAALARLSRAGDLSRRLREERRTLALEEEKLAARLNRLGRYQGDLEQAARSTLPEEQTIDIFENRFKRHEQQQAEIEADLRRAENELASVEEGLAALDGADGPEEEDLFKAREERDRGWALVRRTWNLKLPPDGAVLDFVSKHGGAGSLADAFEHSLKQTDSLSDRLRQSAVRRAELNRLVTSRKHISERVARLEARVAEVRKTVRVLEKEWEEVWSGSGVSPGAPVEMRLWLHQFNGLMERAEGLGELRLRVEELKEMVADHSRALQAGIEASGRKVSSGLTLEEIADAARDVVAAVERGRARQRELETRRKDLATRKAKNENELARLEREVREWRTGWGEAIASLGLSKDAVPAEVRAVLEEMRKLEELDARTGELHHRIQGIDQDAARFDEQVAALVRELAAPLAGLGTFEAAKGLYRTFRQAQRAADHRDRLQSRLAAMETRHMEASRAVSRLEARILAMCEEAGCESAAEVPQRIKDSEQRLRIEEELRQVEQQMRHLSGGMELSAFVAELESVDGDSIAAALEAVESSTQALDRERSELDQAIGTERQILTTMDGNPRAAELAQDAEDIAARIGNKVAQYVQLRLAWLVLHRSVESYREKNQGPILTRSGELFEELTRGAFAGLRVEYDRKDAPVLVGVRPDKSSFVHVENMSDGTRDQLYLAIRLASLATYVERKGPMPFLVDDVLVNFDDDRSLAALKVLTRLSDATQIVFFTHHRHLVDMAENVLSGNNLFVHELTA